MSFTARDVIKQAFKKLVIGSDGETLIAEQMNDGLILFQLMLSAWGGRSLLTAAQIQDSFTLTGNLASYTIGPSVLSPNFITSKPYRIISAFIRDQTGTDYPTSIISREEYNAFQTKTDTGLPENLFYNPGPTQQASQVGNIYFYLTPDANNTYTIFLESEKPFTAIASLDTVLTFDQVYYPAMVFNLALLLATEYGAPLHPEVKPAAEEFMRIIETINSANKRTVVNLGFPGSGQHRANIFDGR